MSRGAFAQADVQRIIRAAEKEGAAVQVDLRSLVVTVIPGFHKRHDIDAILPQRGILPPGNLAPDGKENFDED